MLSSDYKDYLGIRINFLLDRFKKHPDFPALHTGYDSITGQEFEKEFILPYAWINGRGLCSFARFATTFPQHREKLLQVSGHIAKWLQRQYIINGGHFPFISHLDGKEKQTSCYCVSGHKSYSDLCCGAGFVEYGSTIQSKELVKLGKTVFSQTLEALWAGRFVDEPEPSPEGLVLENPFSLALDFSNDLFMRFNDIEYLNISARLVEELLDKHYIEDLGAFVEFVGQDGKPFKNENNDYIINPGHSAEFCSYALEFSRIAEEQGKFGKLCERINRIVPELLLWNFDKGWNPRYHGMYNLKEAVSGKVINSNMPWWPQPEMMLALLRGYERTLDTVFLERYLEVHNAYFRNYMNPKTDFGPFQTIDGLTGLPVDIIPACKFQDPEFHSGKNVLAAAELIDRLCKKNLAFYRA